MSVQLKAAVRQMSQLYATGLNLCSQPGAFRNADSVIADLDRACQEAAARVDSLVVTNHPNAIGAIRLVQGRLTAFARTLNSISPRNTEFRLTVAESVTELRPHIDHEAEVMGALKSLGAHVSETAGFFS